MNALVGWLVHTQPLTAVDSNLCLIAALVLLPL